MSASKALPIIVIVIAAGAAAFQTLQVSRVRSEAQASQKQQAEQIQQLQSERDKATGELAALHESAERASKNNEELLKLRGEVTRLRQQAGELTKLQTENSQLKNRASTIKTTESAVTTAVTSPATNAVAGDDVVKRNQCVANLKQIGAAIEQCALAKKITLTSTVTADLIQPYLPGNALPVCPAGGTYTFSSPTTTPTCSIATHNVAW